MPLLTPTFRTQRILAASVAALLTANAFAVASLASNDDDGPGLFRNDAAAAEATAPSIPEPESFAVITTADGRTFVADPSTSEGRRAIADARRSGSQVRNVEVPAKTRTATPVKRGTATTLPVVGGVATGLPTVEQVLKLVTGGTGDGGGGAVEVPTDVADELLKTVTSVVDDTKTTVSSVVDDTKTTVSSVVGQTPVPSIVQQTPLPSTVTTIVGLLGSLVTTVSTTAQGLTPPTTTATPPPTTTPVCTLLVLCH